MNLTIKFRVRKRLFFSYTYLPVVVIILCLNACGIRHMKMINYTTPTISIDTAFQATGILRGKYHAKRLTKALEILLDSMALDGAFNFSPNYRLSQKNVSQFSLSAKLAPVRYEDKIVGGFLGFTTDHFTGERESDFSCYGRKPTDWGCFAYNPSMPDSTDYEMLKALFRIGFKLLELVPFKEILTPVNINNSFFKSFSIEKPIRSVSISNKKTAYILTHLMNNIIVFNQETHQRRVIVNYKNFNYYNNYLKKRKDKRKSDIQILASLKSETKHKLILSLKFEGKDVNLITMEDISTTITLDKNRMLSGDYSEAMLKISGLLTSFIMHSTLFDSVNQ